MLPTRRAGDGSALPSSLAAGSRVAGARANLSVPLVGQTTPSTCGAASLLAVARAFGIPCPDEHELARRLNTSPSEGTDPADIAAVASALGLRSSVREDMSLPEIEEALQAGALVIVTYQAGYDRHSGDAAWETIWDCGHYSVATDVDTAGLKLMDPGGALWRTLPSAEFLRRWHDTDRGGRALVHVGVILQR